MAKHRIIMHRGTVIDADHIAPFKGWDGNVNPSILSVGINPGPGQPHSSKLRHPTPGNNDFWHPTTYKHTAPNAPCEIDGEGFHNHPGRDPHHTDYYTVPKFQTVITMHLKNIKSIDGKPVLYVDTDDVERGRGHLDFDESWSIGRISDLLDG